MDQRRNYDQAVTPAAPSGSLEYIAGMPSNVAACVTGRTGGVSRDPYASFNLAFHVGDDPAAVRVNRRYLSCLLARSCSGAGVPGALRTGDPACAAAAPDLTAAPALPMAWMEQTHSNKVLLIDSPGTAPYRCDGLITTQPGLYLAVMTADCLPLLLSSADGTMVGAVHCGWKGLAGGIVHAACSIFKRHGHTALKAWLGPCIGPRSFEVGNEVRECFLAVDAALEPAFRPGGLQGSAGGKYLADLRAICAHLLWREMECDISRSSADTYLETERFFSYRREHVTGRMAAVIGINLSTSLL